MGKINLLVTNANNKFTHAEVSILQKATAAAEDFISRNFEFDYEVDVVFMPPSYFMKTIPEDGISGRTYTSELIVIALDNQQAKITEDAVFETICHEMSHSLRWKKLPEYADTLFQVAILEGLAIVLEEKAMAETKRRHTQHFLQTMQKTDKAMFDTITSQLKHTFNSKQYDYDKIFYNGDACLPRWAGYHLGYYLVKKYLETTHTIIYQATLASYQDFEKVLEV